VFLRVERGPPAAAELCRSSLDCRPIKTPLAVFERRGEAWGGGDRHQRRREAAGRSSPFRRRASGR
jgi:hypothetical protein